MTVEDRHSDRELSTSAEDRSTDRDPGTAEDRHGDRTPGSTPDSRRAARASGSIAEDRQTARTPGTALDTRRTELDRSQTVDGLNAFERAAGESLTPPRRNGEMIFEAPWESRAYGMAILLQPKTAYTWEQFAGLLDAQKPDDDYYHRWVAALERLLIDQGTLSPEEIETRTNQYASGAFDHH
jgi:nitrile hydratase accessory protein